MDKVIYLNELYDYYKELFTSKQQMYFEDYYWNNLSLGEIADNNNVSRNAIHNQLKIIEDKLIELENILKLNKKKDNIINLLNGKVDEKLLDEIKNLL
ncbi:MAG: HTH domain-containing protein [Bacilli bacterium]|nr:HTH domain-containing protein [Bacilli bacterium]